MTEDNNQQQSGNPQERFSDEAPLPPRQSRTPVAQWWDAQQNGSTPTRPRGPMEDHTPGPDWGHGSGTGFYGGSRQAQDAKRTESNALAAMVLALVGLVFPPLAVAGLVLTHWAVRGGQRTVALIIGWLVLVGTVVAIIAVIAAGAAASKSYDNYMNSPYAQCMSDPSTSYYDCQGLSTDGG